MHEYSPSGGIVPPVVEVRSFKPNIYQDTFGKICEVLDYLRLLIIIFVLFIVIRDIYYKKSKSNLADEKNSNKSDKSPTLVFGILLSPSIFLNLFLIGIFFTCFAFKLIYLTQDVTQYFASDVVEDWATITNYVCIFMLMFY